MTEEKKDTRHGKPAEGTWKLQVNFPEDMADAIKARAVKDGVAHAVVIKAALRRYLGLRP